MTNLLQTTEEIWKYIPGYENAYQASTLGRIQSLDRTIYKKNNCGYQYIFRKGKILKPFKQRDGYVLIDLQDKTFIVQRIIWRTFKGKIPKGWFAIMHINNIKSDNRLCNLRLGTYSENSIQAVNDNLYTHGRTGKHGIENPQSKKVKQLDLSGNLIAVYESVVEASKAVGMGQGHLSNTIKNSYKTKKGFMFRYV